MTMCSVKAFALLSIALTFGLPGAPAQQAKGPAGMWRVQFATPLGQRASTSPDRPISHLLKFHCTAPVCPGCDVSQAKSGSWAGPGFTCASANCGNVARCSRLQAWTSATVPALRPKSSLTKSVNDVWLSKYRPFGELARESDVEKLVRRKDAELPESDSSPDDSASLDDEPSDEIELVLPLRASNGLNCVGGADRRV